MKRWTARQLAEHLQVADAALLRGERFTVGGEGPEVPPLYPHQVAALEALEARPASTILHLPTGAGKTRIATEFIARTLRHRPDTHILWTSYPTTLIRQAMARLAEFSAELPPQTTFAWLRSDRRALGRSGLFDGLSVSFALRGTLTSLLADVGDRPRKSALRRLLGSGRPLVLIYDECHQLGASRLQRAWRVMHKKLSPEVQRPRVLGLSATPVPRHKRRRALLRHTIFPPHVGAVSDRDFAWGMDVAHRVPNRELEELGVLCPVNAWQQRSGFFDIPLALLKRVSRRHPIDEPPEERAGPDDLLRFSGQFNARVMSHPDVLRFLAARVAARIDSLGKTLVFLPKIKTADAFVELLEAHPATRGRVFVVHTRVGQEEDDPRPGIYEQLAAFKARGDEPCIMVNVEMLTTGFDDPKIRTILLGRLTYSMNLFWQMIGRGARGPRSGGTALCNVIDPIRLTRLYPIADGYRPTLTRSNDDLVGGDQGGLGRMDPSLSVVERAPADPLPDEVDESWFASVRLDEDDLVSVPRLPEPEAVQEPLPPGWGAPLPLPAQRAVTANDRLAALLAASSDENLTRCCAALGVGETDRASAARALVSVCARGRARVSELFDAMLGTEAKALARAAGITCTTSKKSAQVSALIHCYLLAEPTPPLNALLSSWSPSELARLLRAGSGVYAVLDRRYDKRGLQGLLDQLGQPRSAKNKRILIQRIFETFLARELAANLL